ncbi:MAG: hypothetical protein HY207_09900 [Nitrospirae bacterium]|nr:hypothetical protein [Nitrospirota bacterium]
MTTVAMTDPTNSAAALSTLATGSGQAAVTGPTRVDFKAKARTEITVLTNEGDLVTISGKASLRTAYMGYDSQGRPVGGPDAGATTLAASFRQQLSISVRGDLNKEELADIERLFGEIQTAFENALTGGPNNAAATGLPFADLGSLSAVKASFKYSAKLTAVTGVGPSGQAVSAPPAATPTTTAGPPADTASPATPPAASDGVAVTSLTARVRFAQHIAVYQRVAESAATPPAPAGSLHPAGAAPASSTGTPVPPAGGGAIDPVSHAANRIVGAIRQTRLVAAGLFNLIESFLDTLIAKVSQHPEHDDATVHAAREIKSAVLDRLSAAPPPQSV